MNKAESQQVADYLELFGYQATNMLQKANLVVLNTCVVRQSAEGKVLGMLGYLKGMKSQKSDLSILVTGCFVDSDIKQLEKSFPHVDLFFKPSDYVGLLNWAEKQAIAVPEGIACLPSSQSTKSVLLFQLFRAATISVPIALSPTGGGGKEVASSMKWSVK